MPDVSARFITCSSRVPPQNGAPAAALLLGVAGYIALILVGAAALRLPGALIRGNELSPTSALFMAVNAATLSGFDHNTTLQQYQWLGRLVVLGLMIGGAVLSLMIGGIAVARIIDLPYPPRRVGWFTLAAYTGAVLIGTVLLANNGRSGFEATFLACSAVGNAGLVLGQLPAADGWQTHLVLLPLALGGGLGVVVLMDVWDRLTGRCRCLSRYSTVVLTLTAAIYLIGVLLPLADDAARIVFNNERPPGGVAGVAAEAVDASRTVLNARSAGFSFHYADALPRFAQWLVIPLMLAGSASGGTGGGLKINTLAELWLGMRRALAGVPVGRAFGIALAWTGLYIGIIAIAQIALVYTEPQIPADRMLFEVISAMGNVGLSFGPITLVGPGMFILCAVMTLGRFLPLLILIHMMQTTRDADLPIG